MKRHTITLNAPTSAGGKVLSASSSGSINGMTIAQATQSYCQINLSDIRKSAILIATKRRQREISPLLKLFPMIDISLSMKLAKSHSPILSTL
ncbi:hypothetical protein HH212_24310 [Massilia forsythiae]|uniref:Uncharacterized protein n=1 Tax=Massilia forsythiae TaxID=2728020 RepID=A0A7Z2ZUJ2_9BURK|nr:hypothetical protein [Massilia forsythiae]QJE02741.1 hypothetical protein HH212_24310 [Massilia forsythiae]